jgi:hypothetical protein
VMVSLDTEDRACVRSKSSPSARVLTPLSLGGPDMVHVLPGWDERGGGLRGVEE